jgi:hypothetical protein
LPGRNRGRLGEMLEGLSHWIQDPQEEDPGEGVIGTMRAFTSYVNNLVNAILFSLKKSCCLPLTNIR